MQHEQRKQDSIKHKEMVFMVLPCINDIRPFLVQLMHMQSLLKQIKIKKAAPTCRVHMYPRNCSDLYCDSLAAMRSVVNRRFSASTVQWPDTKSIVSTVHHLSRFGCTVMSVVRSEQLHHCTYQALQSVLNQELFFGQLFD